MTYFEAITKAKAELEVAEDKEWIELAIESMREMEKYKSRLTNVNAAMRKVRLETEKEFRQKVIDLHNSIVLGLTKVEHENILEELNKLIE